jgi:hypothetical protein
MKYLILLLTLSCHLYALDKNDIIKLVSKEHDSSDLMEELKISPFAREYTMKMSSRFPEKLDDLEPVIRKSKIVDGKYIVEETQIETDRVILDYIHITTFSREDQRYKMWLQFTLTLDDEEPLVIIDEFDGIYLEDQKVLSWVQIPNLDRPGMSSSSILKINEDSMEWTSYSYQGGKLSSIMSGIDTPKN